MLHLATATAPSADVWRWHAHIEVWLLVASLVGMYIYAARVIGPKVVPAGVAPVSRKQWMAFGGAIAVLWLASDWPMHDVGEGYLYSVHMVQHLLLTMVMPPLFLMATPRWLADLVLGHGDVRKTVRWLSLPVVAGVIYNAMVVFTHWPPVVDNAVSYGWLHFSLHLMIVTVALLAWMPVCGPIVEWRISLPGQMIYLFLMSVIPTLPGAWLTFATHPIYHVYDTPLRAYGISAVDDQQAAGLIMKLVGGSYLWIIITGLFFVWANRHEKAQQVHRDVSERDVLTWHEVESTFAETPPATEPTAEPRP